MHFTTIPALVALMPVMAKAAPLPSKQHQDIVLPPPPHAFDCVVIERHGKKVTNPMFHDCTQDTAANSTLMWSAHGSVKISNKHGPFNMTTLAEQPNSTSEETAGSKPNSQTQRSVEISAKKGPFDMTTLVDQPNSTAQATASPKPSLQVQQSVEVSAKHGPFIIHDMDELSDDDDDDNNDNNSDKLPRKLAEEPAPDTRFCKAIEHGKIVIGWRPEPSRQWSKTDSHPDFTPPQLQRLQFCDVY